MLTPLDLKDATAVAELFQQAAGVLRGSPFRRGSVVRLPARGRLLATGDLHDNPLHLQRITQLAQLEQSEDHHVILHEMIHSDRLINGVDLSHRMLARAAQLIISHPAQAHPLLANHELAQFTGKGVTKGAGNSVTLFNDGLEYAFGDDALHVADAIHEFLRAFPLALRSDSGLFCSHSLPGPAALSRFDPSVFDRELTEEDYRHPHGAAYLMTWGRGLTVEHVDSLAAAWNVRLFCVGHEHVETGVQVRGEKLLILNSDHDHGRAVPIDLSRVPNAEEALMHAIPLQG